jgi:ribosomal protein S18 acetylase RimI-like enzyme
MRNCVGGSELSVREYVTDDYDSLINLWEDAGLPHRPKGRDRRERIEAELLGGTAVLLVAESKGRLVASAFGTHDGRKGWINRVAVHPEWRRRGVAKKLVEEVENRLAQAGIEIMAVLIESWNVLSIEAFERMGYRRHPDVVYFTKRENAEV